MEGKCDMEIKHPEWLQIETNSLKLYGYDQAWYRTSFRRTRGCGPTAATMMLLYLNIREAEPLSYQNHSISTITNALEDVWNFVTPGWLLGLHSTGKFCKGMEDLWGHYGLNWRCHRLSITAFKSNRPSLSQVVQFLENGISSDCPIAFLNLHKGEATTLYSWHWIVIVSLSYDARQNCYIATCYDGGYLITFDVGLWLASTNLGGGFVYATT